jgi:hypothetical protein
MNNKNEKSHLGDFPFLLLFLLFWKLNHKLASGIISILALERISAAR